MAGDWIKFDCDLPEKPEVWALAERMDLDPDAVVGKLLRVWRWFDAHTEDGNAPSVTRKLLDREVGVSGFADAMIEVGWLIDGGTVLSVSNFDRHNGKTAKNRALTARRVAQHKRKGNDSDNGEVTQPPLPDALPREEKRRDTTTPPCSPPSQGEETTTRKAGAKHDYPDWFEQLWSKRPEREGSNPKKAAYQAARKRLEEGHTEAQLIAGVDAYRSWLTAKGKIGTEFAMQMRTFLGPELHFLSDWTVKPPDRQEAVKARAKDAWRRLWEYLSGRKTHVGLSEKDPELAAAANAIGGIGHLKMQSEEAVRRRWPDFLQWYIDHADTTEPA